MEYGSGRCVVGVWRCVINRSYGCGVCDVQCGGVVQAASVGGYVEQCVVSAFGVRGDQLYEELGLCLFCGCGIVDWSICFDDGVAQGERAEGTGNDMRSSGTIFNEKFLMEVRWERGLYFALTGHGIRRMEWMWR
jgi:hypothetical protein